MRRIAIILMVLLLGLSLVGAAKKKGKPAPAPAPAKPAEAAAPEAAEKPPIFAPTAVGSYAEFHAITRADVGWGLVISHTADVRMAIVGKEMRKPEAPQAAQKPEGGSDPAENAAPRDYRWVELDCFMGDEKPIKVKALVAKDVLETVPMTPTMDWSPFLELPHAIEAVIVQKGDETPKLLPVDKLHDAQIPEWSMVEMMLGTFMNLQVEEGAPENVLVQAGKFDTRYFTVHANAWLPDQMKQKPGMEDVDANAKAVAQVWVSADVPFGIVKATRSIDADFRAPKMKETRHVHVDGTVTLTGYGKDAKSLVTGTPEAVQ